MSTAELISRGTTLLWKPIEVTYPERFNDQDLLNLWAHLSDYQIQQKLEGFIYERDRAYEALSPDRKSRYNPAEDRNNLPIEAMERLLELRQQSALQAA